MHKIKQPRQLSFTSNTHGGKRSGAGRKALPKKGVRHRTRENLGWNTPLHVTVKVLKHIPGLRNKDIVKILNRAVIRAQYKGMRIIKASLQHNHIHIIIESKDKKMLEKGMKAFLITFAKRINKKLSRLGQVIKDRYHLHVLRSPKESKNADDYVINNHAKHSGKLEADPYYFVFCKPMSWLMKKAMGIT